MAINSILRIIYIILVVILIPQRLKQSKLPLVFTIICIVLISLIIIVSLMLNLVKMKEIRLFIVLMNDRGYLIMLILMQLMFFLLLIYIFPIL